jgi:hypothetical protein
MAMAQGQAPIQRNAQARQTNPHLNPIQNIDDIAIITNMYPIGVTSVGIEEHNPAAIQSYFKDSSRFQNKTRVRILDFPRHLSGK